ncbi:MAG: glycerol-3-phosphate dehydrogenase/oxidase, partial [Planctomycetes bacterium]|nr:glycerol-3-phosphate dehydrogenase/oxidase [Planctomycetota bacterium]
MKNLPSSKADHQKLSSGDLDVLVVGGGIVGAGVARDAAMRGLRTCLVEQSDFASGTSSRSTRLLHGGIRYLAQGRVGLVREASKEKTVLHRIAPHLADPLAFIFPTFKHVGLPKWKLSVGVKLYDWLCGRRNLGPSSRMTPEQTLAMLPELSEHGLTGAVRYFDGLTNDSRLVLDTLRSAARHEAALHNYVRFTEAKPSDGHWQCELHDLRSETQQIVRTRCLVNATGPWSDRIPNAKTSLRLTKGVHLVIDRSRLTVPDAVVITEDDRLLFAIPWGERIILGTTDTDYSGPLDDPRCEEEDTEYVLESANQSFPKAHLTKSDVISTWAGLRPLVADPHGDPSDISRRHEITMSHPGWWDVTGGKLTTYRLMAEETVNAMVRHLRISAAECRTATEKLLPENETDRVSSILPPEVSESAVQHFCRSEWARHLDDVMIRRTSWCYYHREHLEIAQRV